MHENTSTVEMQEAPQSTDNGAKSGQPATLHLRLPDLPDYKLGPEGDLNAFKATDAEFVAFARSLVQLDGEDLDHWTWEDRRDFLNFCLDEHILSIQDGRLVELEATIPTAVLESGECLE